MRRLHDAEPGRVGPGRARARVSGGRRGTRWAPAERETRAPLAPGRDGPALPEDA